MEQVFGIVQSQLYNTVSQRLQQVSMATSAEELGSSWRSGGLCGGRFGKGAAAGAEGKPEVEAQGLGEQQACNNLGPMGAQPTHTHKHTQRRAASKYGNKGTIIGQTPRPGLKEGHAHTHTHTHPLERFFPLKG